MNKEKSIKITEISARIANILETEGITRNDFALKLGYSRSQTVYDIMNGKSAPSFDFFYRFVVSEYSERYNIEWLVAGKGEIFKSDFIEPDPPALTKDATIKQFFEQFDPYIARKDAKIVEQAEEIGRLKARIEELERRKGDNASDAHTKIAHAG